jgi:hypothetical protein
LDIAAQAFLAALATIYVMPFFDLELLDMARDVAAFNLPARVGQLFGVSLYPALAALYQRPTAGSLLGWAAKSHVFCEVKVWVTHPLAPAGFDASPSVWPCVYWPGLSCSIWWSSSLAAPI